MSQRWHPWKYAGEHYPHITIETRRELPERIWGVLFGDVIFLCQKLNQARRRCTLTHELVHLERGPVPADPRGRAKEEHTVSVLAARRLITIDALVDAYRWCPAGHAPELAEELWVDIPTLRTRMCTLDPFEVAELEHHLNGDWQWIP